MMVNTTIHSITQLKKVDGVNLLGLKKFLDQLTRAGIDIRKHPQLAEIYLKNSVKRTPLE